jgi:cytochrome c biogenesis protein CcmG/thiol:disulfide interchange protein DsbE
MINWQKIFIPLVFVIVACGIAWVFWYQQSPRLDERGGRVSPISDRPIFVTTLSGKELGIQNLSASFDQPVLVNIFASWCAPCRIEHPLLMDIAEEDRAMIVGIAYHDGRDDIARFLDELGNPYDYVAIDEDGQTSIELGVRGVPETYLFINGRFIDKHSGALTNPDADDLLQKLSTGNTGKDGEDDALN